MDCFAALAMTTSRHAYKSRGAMDCPYTFMQDMVAGTFRLPWEDQVKITDGTSCGFPAPTRVFGPKTAKAAE